VFPLWAEKQNSEPVDSLEIYKYVPNITEEEYRFYQADFLPFSLAQKGRLSTSGFRGMPQGIFQFEFDGNVFDNPVVGFWNEQWTPHWRIQRRNYSKLGFLESLYSTPPTGFKPETNITYFQSNLSFIDIDFSEHITENNYFRLSGNNFKRAGSEPSGYSNININTYQAELHLKIFKKWALDLYYWHLRHKYNMPPSDPFFFTGDEFKLIGRNGWMKFSGNITDKDSIKFFSEVSINDDGYKQSGNKVRELRYCWANLNLTYLRKISRSHLGFRIAGRYIKNNDKFSWPSRKEGDGNALIIGNLRGKYLKIDFESGLYWNSETKQKPVLAINAEYHSQTLGILGASIFTKPQMTPVLWRTIQNDSIPRYNGKELIEKQGGSIYLKRSISTRIYFKIEPFWARTKNFPVLQSNTTGWQIEQFENYGINFFAAFKYWILQLQNDFTYNNNYDKTFSLQFNNISTLQASLGLLKKKLMVEGYLIGRYLGKFNQLEFDRLIYQYRLTNREQGPFFILDFKLQAIIGNFRLFFVWENLTSEDYSIVKDTIEQYRLFHFGLNWLLFD
jgi:hypothetical protein